jgi:hypothetical protein
MARPGHRSPQQKGKFPTAVLRHNPNSNQCSILRIKEPLLDSIGSDTWLLVLLADLENIDKDHLLRCVHYLAIQPSSPPEPSEDDIEFYENGSAFENLFRSRKRTPEQRPPWDTHIRAKRTMFIT